MSFTAQVKDELSRVDPQGDAAKHAQLSALLHVSGTLSYYGPGRYSLRVSTETGAVARTMIKLTHELFDLETPLTVRHSVLHKTRNYLIEIPEQEELVDRGWQNEIITSRSTGCLFKKVWIGDHARPEPFLFRRRDEQFRAAGLFRDFRVIGLHHERPHGYDLERVELRCVLKCVPVELFGGDTELFKHLIV